MKRSLLFVCIGLLAATTASAQSQPAQSGPNNSAVNSPGQNNSNAPVAGRNSFTEGQAKSKILLMDKHGNSQYPGGIQHRQLNIGASPHHDLGAMPQ